VADRGTGFPPTEMPTINAGRNLAILLTDVSVGRLRSVVAGPMRWQLREFSCRPKTRGTLPPAAALPALAAIRPGITNQET
jgi:hypothetical protein